MFGKKKTQLPQAADSPAESPAPATADVEPVAAKQSTTRATKEKTGRKAPNKQNALLVLLRRPAGARLEELMATSGWQAHSVRGFMSGTVKKKLGLEVLSETSNSGRVYRIRADLGSESTVSGGSVAS